MRGKVNKKRRNGSPQSTLFMVEIIILINNINPAGLFQIVISSKGLWSSDQ